jgi:hypothetical protein
MKVLILADSFGNRDHHNRSVNSWTRQLELMIPNCEVTCLGLGSSSLFYSFQELKAQLETQEYDYYIFLFTHYNRFYMPKHGVSNLAHAQKLVAVYKSQVLNTPKHDADLWGTLCAAEAYYTYLQNDSLDLFIYESIIEKAADLLKGKNYIFFPCFESYKDSAVAVKHMGYHPFTGQSIMDKENSNFKRRLRDNVGQSKWVERVSVRTNHMSAHSQIILAQYMVDLMTHGKSNITLNDIKVISGAFIDYFQPVTEIAFETNR